MLTPRRTALALLLACASAAAFAQPPVTYRLSFPEPQHRWMQVEIVFSDVPDGPLPVRMSRSSPGRYALHEFAKNVYDVQIDDGAGRALEVEQSNPNEWDVTGHAGTVRVRYRVYGNRTDGTFLAVDETHAHFNVPAALMWARGMERRAVRVTFDPPPGSDWKAATQLHPTDDPRTFTAANLQYLVDSPIELSRHTLRTFQVSGRTFRLALHHDGAEGDADRLAADLERIVREEEAVFGELPEYEGGAYTFLADYLPYASRDGMEHRNSTLVTSSGALRFADERFDIVATAAHEFFHGWNVERIRPKSLEPFDLERANMSGELWFAEGFTSYYQAIVMQRAGLADLSTTASALGQALDTVIRSPGRQYRSAEGMSRMAPLVDAAVYNDQTDFGNTFISYYTWGTALGLGLDLSLRERTGGRVTLDDYMRALWTAYGKDAAETEGAVARPYTTQDLRDRLADVSGDRAFADDFFDRYVQGREVMDYEALLARAGMLLRARNPGRAWIGAVRVSVDRGTARVSAPTIEGTPAYLAGLDRDDEIVSIDGEAVGSPGKLEEILAKRAPGQTLQVRIRRRGAAATLTVLTAEDPRLELVPAETVRPLTPAERSLRDAWLSSKVQ